MLRRISFTILSLVLLMPTLALATDVGGIIDSDTTWTLANSPYNITSVVQVAEGVTLTIEPGVILKGIQAISYEIQVWGTLYAVGTDASRIVFSDSTNVLGKGSNASIHLEYIESYSNIFTTAVEILMVIRNSIFHTGSIQIQSPNDILEKNIFIDSGVYVQHDSPSIVIRNNLFANPNSTNQRLKIYVDEATPIIEYNTFLSTDWVVIENYCCSTTNNVTATNNYWNTTDTAVIDAMIYDRNDDLSRGYIYYTPYLTEPHPDTPLFIVADFSAAPTSGKAPLTVNFSDQSIGATSWSWDFGDGSTSTEQNPSHTYTDPGTYTVSLTSAGPEGSDSKTKTDFITVNGVNFSDVATSAVLANMYFSTSLAYSGYAMDDPQYYSLAQLYAQSAYDYAEDTYEKASDADNAGTSFWGTYAVQYAQSELSARSQALTYIDLAVQYATAGNYETAEYYLGYSLALSSTANLYNGSVIWCASMESNGTTQ